jgi:hypothetical protein
MRRTSSAGRRPSGRSGARKHHRLPAGLLQPGEGFRACRPRAAVRPCHPTAMGRVAVTAWMRASRRPVRRCSPSTTCRRHAYHRRRCCKSSKAVAGPASAETLARRVCSVSDRRLGADRSRRAGGIASLCGRSQRRGARGATKDDPAAPEPGRLGLRWGRARLMFEPEFSALDCSCARSSVSEEGKEGPRRSSARASTSRGRPRTSGA